MSDLRELLRPFEGPPTTRPSRSVPLAERVALSIDYPGNDVECWPWRGVTATDGYARVHAFGRDRYVHRVVYELLVGPIPEGLTLDHTCHNSDSSCGGGPSCSHRRCCNPAHLEPVTIRVNALRGNTIAAHHAAKTHCVHGHRLADSPSRPRVCRLCARRRNAEYRQRQRGERQ